MKLTNPKSGDQIDSPFDTHRDAALKLIARVNAGEFFKTEFPYSMIESLGSKRGPSEGQAYWLHKLAIEGAGKPKAQVATAKVNVGRIVEMFANAQKKLKHPKIVLGDVKFYVAGSRSRYAEQLMIVSPQYGGAYYGRIDKDGNLFDGRDMTDEVREKVIALAENPESVASEHGRVTGNCCFCGRALTDPRSVEVGYGPVCAERYLLDWGSVKRNGTVRNVRKKAKRAIA